MDGGAWRATPRGVAGSRDTTERLTHKGVGSQDDGKSLHWSCCHVTGGETEVWRFGESALLLGKWL